MSIATEDVLKGGKGNASRAHTALLCEMNLPLRRFFYPLGFPVEIRTNDVRILEAAEESFGHNTSLYTPTGLVICIGVTEDHAVECPPEPVRRAWGHLYSLLADQGNYSLLDCDRGTNFTWLNQATVSNRMYLRNNFLEKVVYLLLGALVVTDLHAGCVSFNEKGILLCGDSGAGKSTLSYACARAGWIYTSDDTSYLINACDPLRVVGHAHRVRFRPEGRNLFPELMEHAITPRMEGKASIEVSVAKLPPINSSPEAIVSAVVYLKRHPQALGSFVRLPRGSATERMSQELYSTGMIRANHERILQRFVDVPTYELHYAALEDGLKELEKLVDTL